MPLVKLPVAEISYLDQPASRQNSDDDLPILLLHGFSSSIRDNWLDTLWVKYLNNIGFRVIAVDNRGHGESEKFYSESDYTLDAMAGDAIDLLDHLEIPKVNVMGYSMGSRIATMVTVSHPDRVAQVILGGNGYGMIEGTGDWTHVRDGLLAASPEDIKDPRAVAFRRFADRTGSDRKALAACAMGLRQVFTRQQFASIINPVLVAIGSKDDIAGSGQKLANCMTNARVFSIPGRDHMRASADKVFKEEVARFLQKS